ncbi:MAG: YajQ family cyclic di-GMP-binding protein [Gemmatimonadetes bacterium]|nr:YajQ family cyclic di-GMP-binding protein [Gemmatimonadota bacterium]
MAKKASFDITTGVDLQEVDNAVNMASKEIATRYDFKGASCTLEFDRAAAVVRLDADDAYRMEALLGVLREKLARRKVPLKNIDEGKIEMGSLGRARITVGLKQGIDQETAKKISKDIRDHGFKKVQVSIQGDELRVTAGSRDTLQEVIALVRAGDYGMELSFGNYR